MDLYAQAVEPQLEYRLEEAFCTRDDFSDDLLKKLEKTYRLLPVTFGKPDAPEDPIEYARSSLFGESTLTNALRHDMCSGEGSSKGNPYPAASTYYQELTDEIALVGTNPLPELEKLSEQKQQQAITNIWNTRTNALRTHLSNWLPTGT